MGTDVIVKVNHKVAFDNRDASEVAEKLTAKLNTIAFTQDELLLVRNSNSLSDKFVFTPPEPDFDAAKNSYLSFVNPLNLHIDRSQCEFILAIRYRTWCCAAEEGRAQWRNIFRKVALAIGGDTVIYLADNAHQLEKYSYIESSEETLAALNRDFGSPAASPFEAYGNGSYEMTKCYFIEKLTD